MLTPLLLTATVNPRGMVNAAFTVRERAAQYVAAVRFYLDVLPEDASVVFAENSGQLEEVRKHFLGETRVEWLDVTTLDAPYAYDQQRGKGYNEWLLMRQAVSQSRVITRAGVFFKVTGRLRILNIVKMLRECQRRDAGLRFLADCKDHDVYRLLRLPVCSHSGECRYFFTSVEFFLSEIFPGYATLCDYASATADHGQEHPTQRLAEDLMLEVCRKARQLPHCHDRFRTQARISGRGGHDLGPGMKFFTSTDNDSPLLRFKCALRQGLRWLMPWWRC